MPTRFEVYQSSSPVRTKPLTRYSSYVQVSCRKASFGGQGMALASGTELVFNVRAGWPRTAMTRFRSVPVPKVLLASLATAETSNMEQEQQPNDRCARKINRS